MINAAITPGIHPKRVSIKVITTDPQPWSKTAKGGKIIAKITLISDIYFDFNFHYFNVEMACMIQCIRPVLENFRLI